ncbi:hypothetical protein, partial [Paracoccus sp. (in: a-proteobacteria)]
MPRIDSGEESFDVTIPQGLRLALVDLALTEASIGAGAELATLPPRGTTGRLRLAVRWRHPVPAGALTFRLRV